MSTKPHNTIRSFALIVVAITSGFLIYLSLHLTGILAAPNWCNRAMGAAEDVEGKTRPEFAVAGCYRLLERQLDALALNSHITIGVLALCLGVLIVIVIAGGRLSLTASKTGFSADVGKDGKVAGAKRVEDAASEEREAIEEEAGEAPPRTPGGEDARIG